MRIIFVGMHHKEDKLPLCSTTKSGKMIDKIISQLSIPSNATVLKTNLCYTNYFPDDRQIIVSKQLWLDVYLPEEVDILVLLGGFVHKNFPIKNVSARIVKIAHPSSTNYRNNNQKEEYISKAVKAIQSFLS